MTLSLLPLNIIRRILIIASLFLPFLLIIHGGTLKSQPVKNIALKERMLPLNRPMFNITEIIDASQRGDTLGYITNSSGGRRLGILKNGTEKALRDYLKVAMPRVDTFPDYSLRVLQMEILESPVGSDERGTAFVFVELYKKDNNSYSLAGRSRQAANQIRIDVSPFHEENLREALSKCLVDMEAQIAGGNGENKSYSRDELEAKVSREDVRALTLMLPESTLLDDELDVENNRSSFNVRIQGKYGILGEDENTMELSGTLYKGDAISFLIPQYIIGFELVNENHFTITPGAGLRTKIAGNLSAEINARVLIGILNLEDEETTERNDTSDELLFGGEGYGGIFYETGTGKGFVFSLGFIGQFYNMDEYEFHPGGKIGVGYRF